MKAIMFLLKKLIRLIISNDDKTMQSIDLIETYAYGMNKDLASKWKKTKFNNIIKYTKLINFDDATKEHKNRNPN